MSSLCGIIGSGFTWAKNIVYNAPSTVLSGIQSAYSVLTAPQAPVQEQRIRVSDVHQLFAASGPVIRRSQETQENIQLVLMKAATDGDLKTLIRMQKQGISLESFDIYGKSAFHYAAQANQKDVLDLFWYYGCNLDIRDIDGNPIEFNAPRDMQEHIHALRRKSNRFHLPFPIYEYYSPENLVFKGGGPKGIAYVGTMRCLEDHNALHSLKRTAGTSAGAITAALVATGYNSHELEDVLNRTDLVELLDHPLSDVQNGLRFIYHNPLQAIRMLPTITLGQGVQAVKNTAYAVAATAYGILSAPFKGTGLCEGEKFRLWMENLIAQKTGIAHCTFGELKRLSENDARFKQLYVFTTNVTGAKRVSCINTEDPECDRVIISDAVRASTAIPGIFKPHILHIKNEIGARVPAHHLGLHWDGGIHVNYPIDAFDQLKYRSTNPREGSRKDTNMQTLGFNLVDPEVIRERRRFAIRRAPSNERSPFGLSLDAISIIREGEDTRHSRDPHFLSAR